ncbi:hypothetical protein BKA70DRAFT_1427757 [Coprinopsis sp. MPI-PUGE-AT-0042]|nr:hypothetical protein BKA70DRAFT_1427757 [Coprinopsis sp. MPI-PUGE-AT-0042]
MHARVFASIIALLSACTTLAFVLPVAIPQQDDGGNMPPEAVGHIIQGLDANQGVAGNLVEILLGRDSAPVADTAAVEESPVFGVVGEFIDSLTPF